MSTWRQPPAVVLMTGAAFSWGAGTVMTKVTLSQLSPLDLLGVELVSGTAVIWGVLLVRRGQGLELTHWRGAAILGLLEPALSFALFDFGLDRTGAADGAILIASESLFVALLARAALGERFGKRVATAVAVGFAGSVIVGLGASGQGRSLLGDGLVLAASAAAAAYSVAARRLAAAQDADALSITAVQLLAATVVSLPLFLGGLLAGHSQLGEANSAHLLAALATGLLGTAIPFLLYNRAIRDLQATRAALVLNLIPVFGVALAVALLSERLGWVQLGGGVTVLLAVLASEWFADNGLPDPTLA